MVLYVPLFRDPTVSMNVEEPQLSQKSGIASQNRPTTESRSAEAYLPQCRHFQQYSRSEIHWSRRRPLPSGPYPRIADRCVVSKIFPACRIARALRCGPCHSSLRWTYPIVPNSATTEWIRLHGDGLVRSCNITSGIPRRRRHGLTCPVIK